MVKKKQRNSKRKKLKQQHAYYPYTCYRSNHGLVIFFNPDVEAEIEHATAATLKEFVAMKTRPINNSVKKWAERAKSGVKSIVEWLRIGKIKNRAAIERLEKRNRDYFWHETHKNPKKKTKSRDSTIYSTMKKHLWVVLYPYRTNCTDQWGNSFIYSNSRN